MKRWIRLAASLYPRRWRDRYALEFQALIDDVNPGWRDLVDVMLGAIKMQLAIASTYWKLAGVAAIAGAIVAGTASFGVPRRYVSSAVIRLVPGQVAEAVGRRGSTQERVDNSSAAQILEIQDRVVSRHSLAEIILDPALDLYPEERQRLPLEDLIEQMRKDIQVTPVPVSPKARSAVTAKISFAYPNKEKARDVVRRLTIRFTEQNANINSARAAWWHVLWPVSDPPPAGEELVVLDPATLPSYPVSPNRLEFLAGGLGAGLLLGLLTASVMRRPKWTLQITGFAAAGCALAFAISFLLPANYTSTAELRFSSAFVPQRLAGVVAGRPAIDTFRQLEQEVLSRESLSPIIQKPSLNLYPKQRAHEPLEEIIQSMRRKDIQIRQVNPPFVSTLAFTISFSYPDPNKASRVVQELVSGFENKYITAVNKRTAETSADVRTAIEHKAGQNLEVVDPANVPQTRDGPGRLTFAACGLPLGLLAGLLTTRFRQRRYPALAAQ